MNNESDLQNKVIKYSLIGIGIGLCNFALLKRYKTTKSNEWLIRTGLGIKDIQVSKKFIQWPFQNIEYVNITPRSYNFTICAMSKEKKNFEFPLIFTIGPKNDSDSLIKYSQSMLNQSNFTYEYLMKGIFGGETKIIASNLSIEDIYTDRTSFTNQIVSKVQEHVDQFGLIIYNANIEELTDSVKSNYFVNLAQKIQSKAESRVKS